jgi:hypothetical protein
MRAVAVDFAFFCCIILEQIGIYPFLFVWPPIPEGGKRVVSLSGLRATAGTGMAGRPAVEEDDEHVYG